MKKTTLMLVSSALLALGLSQAQPALASTTKTLTSNAYIYNAKGKKITRLGKLLMGQSITILATKKIAGKKFYRFSKDKYVKAANFTKTHLTADGKYIIKNRKLYTKQGIPVSGLDDKYGLTNKPINTQKQNVAKNSSTNASSDTSSKKTVPTTERQNLTKSSTKTAPTITARDEYYAKKYAYKDIYMTDAEVQRFEDRFWKDIQDYRVAKGYPKYKSNAELTHLTNQVALPGTPEFKSLGNMISQNYQHIGEFLPGLTRLGLNMAHSFSYTDAIGNDSMYGVYYGTWSNLKTPEAKADRLFNMFKESDDVDFDLLTGMKERYAYGAISARFYYDDIHGDLNGIGFTLINADGTSPEWIEAWNNAN